MKTEPMAPGSGVLLFVTPDQVERKVHAPIVQVLARKASWQWLHLDHNRPAARQWIREQRDLPEDIADALLADRTRPRCSTWDGGLMFIGRGVNLNDESLPEDMVSIRAWLSADRLVTVVRRRVRAAEDLAKALEAHEPRLVVVCPGELLLMLLTSLLDRMTPIVYETVEELDDVLHALAGEAMSPDRQQLIRLRLRILSMRRYVLPLRDAINELQHAPADLLPDAQGQAIANLADRTTRIYEELETLDARAEVARSELAGEEAEKLNRRLYALAIITAIFLPLSFLTGLLGMNVAGIPFTSQPWAFWIWTIAFVAVLGGQLIALRRLGWL